MRSKNIAEYEFRPYLHVRRNRCRAIEAANFVTD